MAYCKTMMHVVQPGDTFYRLAQRYKTTVPEIMMHNPGINPYNLPIGTRLTICAGPDFDMEEKEEVKINNEMRKAWMEHALWTRSYMVSLLDSLPDLEEVEARLLLNPQDIADVFGVIYPPAFLNELTQLLTDHLLIAGDLMKAVKAGNAESAMLLDRQWHQNAERIANRLGAVNGYYDSSELQKMLYTHLELLNRELMARLNGQYDEEIRLFDENVNHLMEMADYLTAGLIKQMGRPKEGR